MPHIQDIITIWEMYFTPERTRKALGTGLGGGGGTESQRETFRLREGGQRKVDPRGRARPFLLGHYSKCPLLTPPVLLRV